MVADEPSNDTRRHEVRREFDVELENLRLARDGGVGEM